MGKRQREHPKNTFPVDPAETLAHQLREVARSPLTWLALAGVVLSMATLPWWAGLPCAGAIAGTAVIAWKKRWPRLAARARVTQIADSNHAQDQSLERGIKQLRKWDYDDYASTLREFLTLKQTIEEGIHRQAVRVPADEEVEKQVDTLCAEVRSDLFKMADIRYTLRKRRKRLDRARKEELSRSLDELKSRVAHALEVVRETKTQLESVIGPVDNGLGSNPALDDAIAQLREQTLLAKRVRDRIHSTMGPDLDHRDETTYAGGRQAMTE